MAAGKVIASVSFYTVRENCTIDQSVIFHMKGSEEKVKIRNYWFYLKSHILKLESYYSGTFCKSQDFPKKIDFSELLEPLCNKVSFCCKHFSNTG